MKLKYRIVQYDFIFAYSAFVAQYKILGMWISIKQNGTGSFFNGSATLCDSFKEAENRVSKHISDNERASDWGMYTKEIIKLDRKDYEAKKPF